MYDVLLMTSCDPLIHLCVPYLTQWEGNATDSIANEDAKEVVVRLYRTWTSYLIYEARYRPDQEGILRLHEFAYETDRERYNCQDPATEIGSYTTILNNAILGIIKKRKM